MSSSEEDSIDEQFAILAKQLRRGRGQTSDGSMLQQIASTLVPDRGPTNAARDLEEHGAIVVDVFDTQARAKWHKRIEAATNSFPEYKAKDGLRTQRVLGGFGAYGNPSSFHHPTIRALRKALKDRIAPVFAAYARAQYGGSARDVNLEMLFDRLCVRHDDFGPVSAESWHRDIYDGKKYKIRQLPQSLPGHKRDIITGGWVNLSSHDQYFVGILGSHNTAHAHEAQAGAEKHGGGFAELSKEQIAAQDPKGQLKAQASKRIGSCNTDKKGKIVIRPGQMLVFFQRLLHAVESARPKHDEFSLRYFSGFRLTCETNSLFEDIRRVIDLGAVPRIPSGQVPPMFSANHRLWFNREQSSAIEKFRRWGKRTFRTSVLFQRKTKSDAIYFTPGSPDNRNPYANKARIMDSLAAYGMLSEAYRYDARDYQVLLPERLL